LNEAPCRRKVAWQIKRFGFIRNGVLRELLRFDAVPGSVPGMNTAQPLPSRIRIMFHHQLRDHLPQPNVGSPERILTTLAGGILLASALRRGSILAGVAGGLLAVRGLSGYCPGYGLLEDRKQKPADDGARPDVDHEDVDEVTLAGEQSFPASDPPSFHPGIA
jgi:Protein of unknown function (DUF2892)